MTIQDLRIIEAMSKYGGSFAKAVANAAKFADDNNYNTLKRSFPELWERYESFVVFLNKED
jgi:hypothetical protein